MSEAHWKAGIALDKAWVVSTAFAFTGGQFNPGAEPDIVNGLSASLGVTLPQAYLDFLRQHNGGEGFIGDHYLILWKAEELASFNREYEVEVYAPGILLFGSSGGGEGYGFDTNSPAISIVSLPFIGMASEYADHVADDFHSFLASMASQ